MYICIFFDTGTYIYIYIESRILTHLPVRLQDKRGEAPLVLSSNVERACACVCRLFSSCLVLPAFQSCFAVRSFNFETENPFASDNSASQRVNLND